ncbi:hypothetical protein F5146DRAFT_1022125 [Armillaria mellea]|nr:hypothetical protein F5146DRAFT_1022125 [Armillaria mellea]
MKYDVSATRKEHMLCRDICSNAFSSPTVDHEYGMFPPAYIFEEIKCAVCLRTPFHNPIYLNMKSCSAANDSPYTTPRHSAAHMCDVEAVEHLTIAYALARRSSRQFMQLSPDPRSSYLPLSGAPPVWSLISDFSIHMNSREFQNAHPRAENAIALMAKEAASVTFTILAALEDVIPDLSRRKRLCIHIAGAGHRELSCAGLMEELLHFLPCLEHVVVVYAGPETTGWSRTSIFHTGSYADFDSKAYPPDFIAVLNSGFTEMETKGRQASLQVILSGDGSRVGGEGDEGYGARALLRVRS